MTQPHPSVGRRRFLSTLAGSTAAMTIASMVGPVPAADPPPVTNPRATDGDERFEPNWDERVTISVGEKSGDMIGQTDKVIQAALDYLARLGGGTVKVLPGTYKFWNAVWMPSRVRLAGSGTDSIITRLPSRRTELTLDSDWYDQEVTLKDASAFQVGDGVVFQATNPHNNGGIVIERTLVARNGNRFKLNDGLRENLWLSGKPSCASLNPTRFFPQGTTYGFCTTSVSETIRGGCWHAGAFGLQPECSASQRWRRCGKTLRDQGHQTNYSKSGIPADATP